MSRPGKKEGKMDRKRFLVEGAKAGLGCCAAALALEGTVAGQAAGPQTPGEGLSADLRRRMADGALTPDWAKAEKAEAWITALMDHLDAQLDEPARIRLLNACGRSCYANAFGVADRRRPSPETAEAFLKSLEQAGYLVERGPEETVVHYGWAGKQSPMGLSLREGWCLCPLVENPTPGLSGTYCNCSAGYIQETFERATGRTVRSVEVLESLKRGGKDCRFRVVLSNE
jgi:hypothetical protein